MTARRDPAARATRAWDSLNQQIIGCEKCPRLREYCRQVASEKRKAYRDWDYWGRPVPNFGDSRAALLIVGLAPAAHGANRTGRMFTGDRSGEWLYRALFRAGFANQAECQNPADGLQLIDCAITATCHCAPPHNRPLPDEVVNCRSWLEQTVAIVQPRVYLALGQIGWNSVVTFARQQQWIGRAAVKFGHAAVASLGADRWLIGSYHPSQQNTFTGVLTEEMLDGVFMRVKELLSKSR
jgi:uracil-DNA glycosylase family 4